jgi:BioD-like phosphotransacetylase family protein
LAGKNLGYFKPRIVSAVTNSAIRSDSDAVFIKQLLNLSEPVDALCPLFRSRQDMINNIGLACSEIAPGKDVMVIEGSSEYYELSGRIAELLSAKVLIAEKYSGELFKSIGTYTQFGHSLLGVVLTKVPKLKMEHVRKEASARLDQAGVKFLGMLPEDRTLLSMSISGLAEFIHGDFVSGTEQSEELIENLVISTTGLDPGLEYYNRKPNKALIFTRAPRYRHPSASRSASKCAVLTGPVSTNQTLIDEFKSKNIPIITTGDFISNMVISLENTMGKARFNQLKKMPRLTELLEQYLDLRTLDRELGITA